MKKLSIVVAILAISGTAWYGWQHFQPASPTSAETAKGGAKNDAPPATVSTTLAKRQDVDVILTANASVSPVANVDLRPQVSNTIVKVHVKEGDQVSQGQLLFSLDQRNELANLQRAKAQIAKDQASLQDLERQLKRSQELLAQNFISRGASDTLQSQVQAQQANLALDMANLQSAQVALDYTQIKAPMTGRIGAINVFPGSLVQASTTLAQISQLHPINLSFTLPEEHLPALLAAQKAGEVTVQTNQPGSNQTLLGKLSFIDNAVDTNAGAIKLKAQFNNPNFALWPGQYANVSLTVSRLKDVVVVPIGAVITNAKGKSVFTVEADQTAKQRPITLVATIGALAVVNGLQGGEKVVMEGRQNLRPGGKIKELNNGDKNTDKAKAGKGNQDEKASPTANTSSAGSAGNTSNSPATSSPSATPKAKDGAA